MAKNKTTETKNSVTDFINAVADEKKRRDSFDLTVLMAEVTGFEAKLWGPAIIGFGSVHYKYDSGREGDMPLVAFSPRRNALVLYLPNFIGRAELLVKLGKHTTGKGCIYIKKLDDIDKAVLKELIQAAIEYKKYN